MFEHIACYNTENNHAGALQAMISDSQEVGIDHFDLDPLATHGKKQWSKTYTKKITETCPRDRK